MTNVAYIDWVLEQVKLTKPSAVYWVDGSKEDLEKLIDIGVNTEKVNNSPVFVKIECRGCA